MGCKNEKQLAIDQSNTLPTDPGNNYQSTRTNLRARRRVTPDETPDYNPESLEPIQKLKSRKPEINPTPVSSGEFEDLIHQIPNFDKIIEDKLSRLDQIKVNEFDKNLQEIPLTEFTNDDGQKYIYGGNVDPEGNLKGFGRLFIENSKSYYEGGFLNNYFNGEGLLISGKGDSYIGDWKNGEAFGEGQIDLASGAKFKGHFKNSYKDGVGNEECANGDTYQGTYYQNLRNGNGYYTFKGRNGNEGIYQGKFDRGYMHDTDGAYQWSDGRIYNGNINNGVIDGNGAMQYIDGSVYRGHFRNQKKDGRGQYRWSNGDTLQGYWENNNLEGQAILDMNNARFKVIYEYDNPIKVEKDDDYEDNYQSFEQ